MMSKDHQLLLILAVAVVGCLLVPKTSASEIGLDGVLNIIKIGKDVIVTIAKTWSIVDQHVDFSEIPTPILDKTESKLFEKIGNISDKLDKMADQIDAVGTKTMALVLQNLPNQVRLELRLKDLLDYLTLVDVIYQDFQNYVKDQKSIERLTLEDFAKNVVSHDSTSIRSLVERIHAFIVPSGWGVTNTGLLKLLRKSLETVEGHMLCSFQQSPQQVLHNLYNAIALTELKGYTMMQFSYMLLRLYDQGNFTKEAQLMTGRYKQRTNSAVESVRNVMKDASRELWNCDPKKHIKGETYEEITQLLQGCIQNEQDLNPEDNCMENCAEYTYMDSNSRSKKNGKQPKKWTGKVINCKFFDSDIWVCPASPFTGRKYEYIEYKNKLVGRKQRSCKDRTQLTSSTKWVFWECSYCFCLCDKQGINSDRYFNLRPAIADVANNRVVTGLRFVKKNRIIHLQIQEGELLPRGKINIDTVHWVPVEEYRIYNRKIFAGQDFHVLSWEKRSIDLDDLEAPEGYLVTGVRFKEIGSHLNFEIYVTKFDFDTGKLVDPTGTSTWKDNPNTDASIVNPRTEVKLTQPDIPTRSPSPSTPTSRSDQYIKFTHSDIDRDVAQTTVPFLDIQKLESLQVVPLSGAGIFHKGKNNFGGFITPKIITYDFSKHLKAVFPSVKIN